MAANNYKFYSQTPGVQSISAFPVNLQGLFISSVTGTATIAVFDELGTNTNNTIVATFSPNVTVCWYPIPCQTRNGLAVSVAATVTYTAIFD